MNKNVKEFLDFIEKTPTAYHAVNNIRTMLEEAGFKELKNEVNYGENYYKVRNDSSIIAFKVPEKKFSKIKMVCSHSDSPCYKLKANPTIVKEGYTVLNSAPYGGMIHSTFMDIPLTIAGRVISIDDNGELKNNLVAYDEPKAMMANVAIHMNGKINKEWEFKPSRDLVPIYGMGERDLLEDIKNDFKIEGKILSHDLFICSDMKPYLWGKDNEFISSPRLDDLECAFASIKALVESESENLIISSVFNNEEVGSGSYMGADSDLLYTVLLKVIKGLNIDESELYDIVENSISVSADNAHALHPNYTNFYDTKNATVVNGGVVVKYSPSQKYTTDSLTAAYLMKLCIDANLKYQEFENHSDVRGGSTLGNILNAQVSMPSVDIGLPQLAMHSAFETAGSKDLEDLFTLLKAHYTTK